MSYLSCIAVDQTLYRNSYIDDLLQECGLVFHIVSFLSLSLSQFEPQWPPLLIIQYILSII